MWRCKCDCGEQYDVVGTSLTRGFTKSCGCLRREFVSNKNRHNSGRCGDLSGSYYKQVKRNAIKRKLQFDISIEDAWNQYESQGGKCALTGVDISFIESDQGKDSYRTGRKHTASLDRINSNIGYINGNIQWVHRDINIMKNNHDEQTFIKLCKLVVEHNDSART